MTRWNIIGILPVLLLLGCVQSQITSFEECVAAGFPVMESYPRQCSDGTNTFVENVTVTFGREQSIPRDAVKMTPEDDLHPPLLNPEFSDDWEDPVPLSPAINTAGAEDSPFIMPGGSTLYFFYTPDVDVPAEEQLIDGVTGIYVSRQENGSWGLAKRVLLQDSGKLALDGCAFVLEDELWFCSARDGYTGVNLFTAELVDDEWTNWQYAGEPLNSYQVGEMHITSDRSEMYFHSDREGGKGGYDIWVTNKTDGEWQEPINVEAVNTDGTEGWPYVNQAVDELWFTRFYNGSPAVFRSVKSGGEWQEPELVISRFAGEPSLDEEDNIYFVHHFYQDGEMVEADIYVAQSK